jgi:hypothetical protein
MIGVRRRRIYRCISLLSLDIEIARADLWKCTWRLIKKKNQLNRSGVVDQPL